MTEMFDMKTIRKWKLLNFQLAVFERLHKKEIEEYQQSVKTKKITRYLKSLDFSSSLVWCRNGSVALDATPCEQLVCPFKQHAADVVDGCIKCQSFAVTDKVTVWAMARHIMPEGLL